MSAERRRLGLYFDIFDHNIVTGDFVDFVARLLRRLGRDIILVLDRLQVHRSGVKQLQARFKRRVQVERVDRIELGQIRAGLVTSAETAREIVELSIDDMNENADHKAFSRGLATRRSIMRWS